MATYYKVQSAPAPAGGRSRWNALFSTMKQGDWFIVPKSDASRARASACNHLPKGTYRTYTVADGLCIQVTKEV